VSGAAAVIVAAGRGTRLGVAAKTLLPLAGRPMLAWALDAAQAADSIASIVIVAGKHTKPDMDALAATGAWPKIVAVVPGGERRQDSVLAGVHATPENADVVAIHDGARPLVTPDLWNAAVAAARELGAAIVAVPVSDTLKRVADGRIAGTVDRTGMWGAQTPQAFRRDLLLDIFRRAGDREVTDEARLCEDLGIPVAIVPGMPENLKVTHPGDVAVADALLAARQSEVGGARMGGMEGMGWPRTGIGYDVHRFAEGRRMVLGGVEIPFDRGLEGHSDADVALHAICDALLGAAGLGDIGKHFPPGDPRFKDADSLDLLRESARLVREAGYEPVNVDVAIVAEAPRIGPHVPLMRERIGAAIGIGAAAVGVKATTNEGMGFVGRQEGIAALATALVAPFGGNR
jgi:2-C-methyl-D-erythritol 4-phosphate cytidylyltransferase/2-C-methyl-D-erythritol 2,4-cyclodiphosphate synthase